MGYFANGTEGMIYEERYCERCQHYSFDEGCPVLELHAIYNYDECNKKDSFLHVLIPRNGTENEQCKMFLEAQKQSDKDEHGSSRGT